MRHLASVKIIDRITPIPGADRIATAHIGGWPVVVSRNGLRVASLQSH